MKNSKKDVDFS